MDQKYTERMEHHRLGSTRATKLRSNLPLPLLPRMSRPMSRACNQCRDACGLCGAGNHPGNECDRSQCEATIEQPTLKEAPSCSRRSRPPPRGVQHSHHGFVEFGAFSGVPRGVIIFYPWNSQPIIPETPAKPRAPTPRSTLASPLLPASRQWRIQEPSGRGPLSGGEPSSRDSSPEAARCHSDETAYA